MKNPSDTGFDEGLGGLCKGAKVMMKRVQNRRRSATLTVIVCLYVFLVVIMNSAGYFGHPSRTGLW